MNDELERLRAVAKAAAVFLKASEELAAHTRASHKPGEMPDRAAVRESHQLWRIACTHQDELAQAVACLREVTPALFAD
jgi:invasion protein IalB